MDNEWKIVEMDGRQYREMTRTEKAESGGVVTLKFFIRQNRTADFEG